MLLMGTDICVYREIKIGDKWYCIEPSMASVHDDHVERHPKSMDIGRDYTLFGILLASSIPATYVDSIHDVPRGLPKDVSPDLSHIKKDGAGCYDITYLTYKEIDDYLEHWKQDLIDTENPIYDFWYDDDIAKIERFNNAPRKKTKEECLEFYLKMWDSSILKCFRDELDKSDYESVWFRWDNEKFKSLKDFPTTDKRIIFYFNC